MSSKRIDISEVQDIISNSEQVLRLCIGNTDNKQTCLSIYELCENQYLFTYEMEQNADRQLRCIVNEVSIEKAISYVIGSHGNNKLDYSVNIEVNELFEHIEIDGSDVTCYETSAEAVLNEI